MVSIPPDSQVGSPAPPRGRRRHGREAAPSAAPSQPQAPARRPGPASTTGLAVPELRPLPAAVPEPARPTPHGRSRALSRVRQGLLVFGVPVTAVVVLELVAAALLLAPDVPVVEEGVVLALAIAVAVAVLVPYRGQRLGTWVVSAAGYAGRRHVFSAIRPDVAARGRDDAVDTVVPPEVAAFFPGLIAVRATSRSGQEIGLVQWQGRWMAVVALSTPQPDVLSTSPPAGVPVDRLLQSLSGKNFGLDAVQVVSQALFGNLSRFGEGTLSRVAAELADKGAVARSRETWVTVRIDPVRAAAAVTARGGALDGLGRLAAAAISRIESEARGHGLTALALEADAVVQVMATTLLQPPAVSDVPVRWTETWKSIASAEAYHRCYAVTSWHQSALDSVGVTSGYGVTVAHEIRGIDASDGVQVVTIVRLTAGTQSALDAGSRQLRAACRTAGVGLRLLRGQQAAAFRMTLPAGQR